MTEKTIGTVARWFEDRGFGFIIPDDQSEDVFLHISRCPDRMALERGATVSFTVEMDRRGSRHAVNVQHYHPTQNDAVRFGERVAL